MAPTHLPHREWAGNQMSSWTRRPHSSQQPSGRGSDGASSGQPSPEPHVVWAEVQANGRAPQALSQSLLNDFEA